MGYCLDGWLIKNNGLTVTVTASGVKFTATNSAQIWSYIDDIADLKGKPLTYHVKPSGGLPLAVTGTVPSTFAEGATALANRYTIAGKLQQQFFAYKSGATELLYATLIFNAGTEITLERAKLEEGSVPTPLAHESRQSRLAKCMERFEWVFSPGDAISERLSAGIWSNDGSVFHARATVRFLTQKRASPGLVQAGTFRVICRNGMGSPTNLTATSVTLLESSRNYGSVRFDGTGAIPADTTRVYVDNAVGGGSLGFSADI
jgi:hypothetical protein